MANDIVKGVGNVATTKDAITTLKQLLATAKDPATRKVFQAALTKIEGKLPGREWIAAQEAAAAKIVASNVSTATKVEQLKAIQAALLAKGDTTAAQIVGALLGSVVPAINNISINVSRVVGGTTLPGLLPDRNKHTNRDTPVKVPRGPKNPDGARTAALPACSAWSTGPRASSRARRAGRFVAIMRNPRNISGGFTQQQPIVIHMHAPSARDTVRADRSWRRYGNGRGSASGEVSGDVTPANPSTMPRTVLT